MLAQQARDVCDVGPTAPQHWANVSYLLGGVWHNFKNKFAKWNGMIGHLMVEQADPSHVKIVVLNLAARGSIPAL